jgi:N-carbamoyl-L-amino-acid hydrolase
MTAAASDLAARITAAVDRQMPRAERLLQSLRERTRDGDGVTRASYGPGEQIGHDIVRAEAETIGLEITTDAAGNLYMTLPGQDRGAPRWISGSHLDSVPNGGNYDGAAGVVAALVSIAAIQDLGITPPQDLTVMAIRAEECSSWFKGDHGGHLGSRAALGLLKASELDTAIHLATGHSLGQSIDDAGFDSKRVAQDSPFLNKHNVRGFAELHIEQGPLLVADDLPAASVTAIRGNLRARDARCIGTYAHSGAVPQHLRQDALLATVELVHALDMACQKIRDAGGDVVFAVGKFHTDAKQDSLTKVPGDVRFTVDIRSQDPSTLQELNLLLQQTADTIGAKRNVRFDLGPRSLSEPAAMDAQCRLRFAAGAAALCLVPKEMACGAGHDAAEFVRAGIPACMILVRSTGESHNPEEHMELADFREGIRLLCWFLATAA